MNAVRMSHYPPDERFLDLCDELGLYVLDELGGWQKSYDTEVGRKLVEETVVRDVNHPSILFWDNGNEGGWNRALDGDFARCAPHSPCDAGGGRTLRRDGWFLSRDRREVGLQELRHILQRLKRLSRTGSSKVFRQDERCRPCHSLRRRRSAGQPTLSPAPSSLPAAAASAGSCSRTASTGRRPPGPAAVPSPARVWP